MEQLLCECDSVSSDFLQNLSYLKELLFFHCETLFEERLELIIYFNRIEKGFTPKYCIYNPLGSQICSRFPPNKFVLIFIRKCALTY